MIEKFDLAHKFSLFTEPWRPKVVSRVNDHEVKLVKIRGEFPWHTHETEDEFFMVWRGTFRVEFRDRVLTLGAGECVVVPRGVEHRTAADDEAEVVCIEPASVTNTGDAVASEFTAPKGVAI